MDPLSEFVSLPFVQFWLAIICVSGLLLIVAWSFILRRRSQRRDATRQAEANAALAAVDPDAVPAKPEPAEVGKNPVEAVSGALRGAGRGIRNFFFYTEEEKAALQTSKRTVEGASNPLPAAQATPALPHVSPLPDTAEVLHLWRDVADGSLIIQIGQEYYRTMGDIAAAGQERRFMAVLRELARIAKETAGEVSTPAPVPIQTVVPPAPEMASPVPSPAAETSTPAKVDSALPMPPQPEVEAIVKAAQRATNRPSLTADLERENAGGIETESLGTFFGNVREAVKRGGRAPEKKPEAPPLTIADHIEEFLQARLRTASPELQGRKIHIRAALHGGVRIEVDGRFYDAVGDIEDETVRQFVIDAIQGWEAGG